MIVNELKNIDINDLSPKQALDLVYELKKISNTIENNREAVVA